MTLSALFVLAALSATPPDIPDRELSGQVTWALFPGVYADGDGQGVEASLLYYGFGFCVGAQPKEGHSLGYVESEAAYWPITLGVGTRFVDGRLGLQGTAALPLLPVFPFVRWASVGTHKETVGVMLKWPFPIRSRH